MRRRSMQMTSPIVPAPTSTGAHTGTVIHDRPPAEPQEILPVNTRQPGALRQA